MKKLFCLISVLVLILCLSGCNTNEICLSTSLQINSDFNGSRIITCKFTKDMTKDKKVIEKVDDIIKSHCPKQLSYEKIETAEGISYIFKLNFISRDDYSNKVKGLLGVEPVITFSAQDNIFTNGIRLKEDFESSQLMEWFVDSVEQEGQTKNLNMSIKSLSSEASINGKVYNTDNKICVNDITNSIINSVVIYTQNNGDSRYERSITISFPSSTVNKLGDSLLAYMKERTDPCAKQTVWFDTKDGREYKVTYTNVTIDQMSKLTNLLLSSKENLKAIYKADSEKSNAFSEYKTFEETLDLSAYAFDSGSYVPLTYSYCSIGAPNETGEFYLDGTWSKKGKLEQGVYSVTLNEPRSRIRIPDSCKYKLSGVDITLSSQTGGAFTRIIDLKYDINPIKSVDYAVNYLGSKSSGAQVEKMLTDSNAMCRITTSGSYKSINNMLYPLLGEGNDLEYYYEEHNTASRNIMKFRDNVCMSGFLTDINSQVPIKYLLKQNSNENINYVGFINSKKETKVDLSFNENSILEINSPSHDFSIAYTSSSLNFSGIISVILVVLLIFSAVSISIFVLNSKWKKLQNKRNSNKNIN